MIRKILILGALGAALGAAGLTLVACGPSSGILATAKTGDCFNVTGKDAMGQPKLIHADCPAGQTSGQSTLPPAPADQAAAPAASAAPPPALPATVKADAQPVCQPVAPTCAVPAAVVHRAKAVRVAHVSATRYTHALNTRHVWRSRKVVRHHHGRTYTETVNEYVPASGEVIATIGAPYSATTELSGGSSREETYVLRDHPVYAPPPPVEDRHYDHRSYESHGSQSYSSAPPPPPPVDTRHYDQRSSQSYSSQSYSSSSSAQRRGPPPPCNCAPARRAPTYEPDGYLTWPNKTEY